VQVGNDVETSRWSAEMAAIEPRMLAAVALHPNDAPDYAERGELDDALAVIAELATRPRVRAIGETGLDFFRTEAGPRRDAQFRSFEAHIEIAKQNDLALQIHDRDAHAAVVSTLQRVGAPDRTVFHCFSGDAELARVCADNGWYMSFAGNITFKNAPNIREALSAAPRHLIMVETDAPFLTPTPYRGRPNAPYLIPHTLRAMAVHLGTDASMLAAQISSNTEEVYGHWDDEPVDAPPGPFEPLA
jgi:TatD DNase family protein